MGAHTQSLCMGKSIFEASGEPESELVELEGEMARAGEAISFFSFGGDRWRDAVDILRNIMRFSGWPLIKEG